MSGLLQACPRCNGFLYWDAFEESPACLNCGFRGWPLCSPQLDRNTGFTKYDEACVRKSFKGRHSKQIVELTEANV